MKPWVTWADVVTALRLPLAALFPFVHRPAWQLVIVCVAAASDFVDGILARRVGSSRVGAVLDPVADKVFAAAAFLTLAGRGLLTWYELVGVLLRDILAVLGFLGTWLLRRPLALPARAGGKAVTVAQILTLLAFIAGSSMARPLAWATAGIAVYATWDYGRIGMRRVGTVLLGLLAAASLALSTAAAQQFSPPKSSGAGRGTRIGLFGFGVRTGLDFKGEGQLLLGTTLDMGNVISSRVRLRPSVEVGVFNGENTYVASFESLWRFTDDEEVATPYVGTGLSMAGHGNCGADPDCPALWLNLVFGLELRYRSTFNWLLEYHGMDALRRHRVYVGFTTRRGN